MASAISAQVISCCEEEEKLEAPRFSSIKKEGSTLLTTLMTVWRRSFGGRRRDETGILMMSVEVGIGEAALKVRSLTGICMFGWSTWLLVVVADVELEEELDDDDPSHPMQSRKQSVRRFFGVGLMLAVAVTAGGNCVDGVRMVGDMAGQQIARG
jgi:hypothetical protein